MRTNGPERNASGDICCYQYLSGGRGMLGLGRPQGRRTYLRGDIEGLRALAVMLVLIFHAGLSLRGGFVGVDVFFVISGFLITSLLADEMRRTGSISLRGFY